MIGELISLLSFGGVDLGRGMEQLIELVTETLTPFFEAILGEYSTGEFFFAKILLLILLFIIIAVIVKKIPTLGDNKAVITIIALVVSIFSVRFMSESQLITGILLPYNTLGIVIVTVLPFLIFFWFVHLTKLESAGRRIAWILFAIVFVLLWYTRNIETGLTTLANQIYGGVLLIIIAVLIFDRKIHSYFALWEIKKLTKNVNDKVVLELLDDLEKAERHGDTAIGKEQAKRIRKRLKELGVKNV